MADTTPAPVEPFVFESVAPGDSDDVEKPVAAGGFAVGDELFAAGVLVG